MVLYRCYTAVGGDGVMGWYYTDVGGDGVMLHRELVHVFSVRSR
jgi:hypothetical protein